MLDKRSRVVLDTLLPSGSDPKMPLGLLETDFDGFYAGFQKNASPSMRFGFRTALLACIWVAPLLIGRLPPITRLKRPTRERALEAMGKSRFYLLRQLMLVLKAVACFCYGADRRVRDSIGMPRP